MGLRKAVKRPTAKEIGISLFDHSCHQIVDIAKLIDMESDVRNGKEQNVVQAKRGELTAALKNIAEQRGLPTEMIEGITPETAANVMEQFRTKIHLAVMEEYEQLHKQQSVS